MMRNVANLRVQLGAVNATNHQQLTCRARLAVTLHLVYAMLGRYATLAWIMGRLEALAC